MFGSDSFPLGPNGSFPKQRIYDAGNEIATPADMEEVYGMSGVAKLPVQERDFHSSIARVKNKMKKGKMMREGQDEQKFRPRSKNRLQETNVLSYGPMFKINNLEEDYQKSGNRENSMIDILSPVEKGRRLGASIFDGRVR